MTIPTRFPVEDELMPVSASPTPNVLVTLYLRRYNEQVLAIFNASEQRTIPSAPGGRKFREYCLRAVAALACEMRC
jgi:hypothetical protein